MSMLLMEAGELWKIQFRNMERVWYYLCYNVNKNKDIILFYNLDDGKICEWVNWSRTHGNGSLYKWKKVA